MKTLKEFRLPDWGTDESTKLAKSITPGQNEEKDPNEYDNEGKMMKDQLDIVMDAADEIYDIVDDMDNLPEWCQNKITKAADYIDSVRDYLMAQDNDDDDEDDEDEDD
jgi:hypothetical protein